MNKKNIGSDFNDFLRDEGIYDEIHAAALKEVFAAELRGAMESAGLTEQALAARMGSKGRNTVRRLLDPKNKSATLMVMVQAAHAAGLEMGLSFKRCVGWTRCAWRSLRSFTAYVWASVVTANLLLIARRQPS